VFKPFTTLPDLLPTSTTLPILVNASDDLLDRLLSHLPPTLILLAAGTPPDDAAQPDSETVQAITMSLEADQKREILAKVLRSPQFSQGLASLSMALRDGGLPTISEALKVPVRNGGLMTRGGIMPMGEGEAMEAFLEGFKKLVEEEEAGEGEEKMETE
jgi:26S proteasome regulatory subunit N13